MPMFIVGQYVIIFSLGMNAAHLVDGALTLGQYNAGAGLALGFQFCALWANWLTKPRMVVPPLSPYVP